MRILHFFFVIFNISSVGESFLSPNVPPPKTCYRKGISWQLTTTTNTWLSPINHCGRRGLTNRLAASGATVDPPPMYEHDKEKEDKSVIADFKKRMNELFKRDGSLSKSSISNSSVEALPQKTSRPSNICVVHSPEEFKHVVAGEKEKIVVVRWYASYCRSCKAIQPYFYRLAEKYREEKVLFVEVPISEKNAILHQGLGVPSVPFGHIYHPTVGLAEELKISKKFFPKFEQILQWYVEGSCNLLPDGSFDPPFTTQTNEYER